MLENKQNKLEALVQRVGGQNTYQYFIFLIFALKWIIAAMILFSLNFFYAVPSFECKDSEVSDYKTCEQFVCSYDDQSFWRSHFKQSNKKSIALDYGVVMVCSKQWVASLLQSVSYIGSLFGYIIMSHIADNQGRKKGQAIAWIICIVGQIIMIFSINLEMIGLGSFFLGFGANAAITIHYSFFKELVLGKTRSIMIIAIQIAFSLGVSLISLLSYLIDDWKYTMGFFIFIPSLISMFFFKFVEQTPEFTLKSGHQKLRASLNRIAKMNKKQELSVSDVQNGLQNYATFSQTNNVSLFDLFRYKSLRYIAIATATINFTIQFIFDGTLLSLDKFGFNIYFDQMLVGLVQVFAAIFAAYIVPRVQRKLYITIALIIIAAVSVSMGIESTTYHHISDEINIHTIIEMILIAILRFLINSVWGVYFVYVSQLFPSEISSISFAWVSIMGTVGATISPYIRLAAADLTMFVIAVLSILMAFLVRTLNETKGKQVRTRIKERQVNTDLEKQRRESILSAG